MISGFQGRQHWGGGAGRVCTPPLPPHPYPTFWRSEKKKGGQGQKRKGFKAETIKKLSPRLKYYWSSHSRVSRIRKCFLLANHGAWQYFSVFHGSPHRNPFRRPCICFALHLTVVAKLPILKSLQKS